MTGMNRNWTKIGIIFIITTILAGGAFVWALVNYIDQKDNVDTKVSSAVSTAVKEQADKDAAAYEKLENDPTRTFAGPEDYGQLSFKYSKAWSVYVDKDASVGGIYRAYLNPVTVPPVSNTQRYALRVTIETKDYEDVIGSFQSLVKRGDLQSSSVKVGGADGTRLDGNFTKDIRGSAVIFKIRDKTVTLRTDANTFKDKFNALIKTVSFND